MKKCLTLKTSRSNNIKIMNEKYSKKNYSPKRSPKYDSSQKKQPPPVETLAESYYYKKQMDAKTDMVFVLHDDEEIEGVIEWYDRDALKILRQDAPNILLLKHNIKFLFKAGERE